MHVACVGGGPAGLYFSILMKKRDPSHEITVYERNPAGATYGFGVTYSTGLLKRLRRADAESAQAIERGSLRWDSYSFGVRDAATVRHGIPGMGIGRRQLLDIFADRARELGVRVEYEREITSEDEVSDADLVVAGDGVNSRLRQSHAEDFGEKFTVGRDYYIWLGTTKVFESFTYRFVETEHGWIWCYGYKYSEDRSTVVVECSPETWRGLGFDRRNEEDSLRLLEKVFADVLDGHPLLGRVSAGDTAHWLNFRTLTNRTWHHGNLVLAGDAAHTAHYSIGVGTRLALGDAAALTSALHRNLPLDEALDLYEQKRRPPIWGAQRSAGRSSRWYEHLPRYVDEPLDVMIGLFRSRRSIVLPFVPPRLYYHVNQAGRRVRALGRRGATVPD